MSSRSNSDHRAVDRHGASTDAAVAAAATRVLGGLHLDARQLTEATAAPLDSVVKALTVLATLIPGTFFTKMKRRGVQAGSDAFVTEMAALREQFGDTLGHLKVDPQGLHQGVALAAAAETAIGPLRALLDVLENIRFFSLATTLKEGRLVYRRAVNVAETSSELAQAIAPYRNSHVRAGKKAAATRRRRQEAEATAPVAAPTPDPTLTTTTTTTSARK